MTIDVDGRSFGEAAGMRVVLRRGPLEVEVSGSSAGELVHVAGRLKREVLDAYLRSLLEDPSARCPGGYAAAAARAWRFGVDLN